MAEAAKLNCDSSVDMGVGKGIYGAVFRDQKGSVIDQLKNELLVLFLLQLIGRSWHVRKLLHGSDHRMVNGN